MFIQPVNSSMLAARTTMATDRIDRRPAQRLTPVASDATSLLPINATAPPKMHEVWLRYSRAIMALPGVLRAGWLAKEPNRISLVLANAELKLLAQLVLADVVDGIVIAAETEDTSGEPGSDSWVRQSPNIVRTMASLPGVYDWMFDGSSYMLFVPSAERQHWLGPLLEPQAAGRGVSIVVGRPT